MCPDCTFYVQPTLDVSADCNLVFATSLSAMTSVSAMPLLLPSAGLTGRFPDVLPVVAAKFQTLELRNTSLLQCNASHILALEECANGTVGSLRISCQVLAAD